jgi:uncharacterized protein (DUF3084 family)
MLKGGKVIQKHFKQLATIQTDITYLVYQRRSIRTRLGVIAFQRDFYKTTSEQQIVMVEEAKPSQADPAVQPKTERELKKEAEKAAKAAKFLAKKAAQAEQQAAAASKAKVNLESICFSF